MVSTLLAHEYAMVKAKLHKLKTRSHKSQMVSHVQIFATPWTVAHQAPLLMGFSRQEYRWCGLPFPSPKDLLFLTQGLNPCLLHCRQILYHLSHQESPLEHIHAFSLRQKHTNIMKSSLCFIHTWELKYKENHISL